MKLHLVILMTFACLVSLQAECHYSKYHLTFEIQTTSDHLIYYNEIPGCQLNIDSIQNQKYLINNLRLRNESDSLILFKDRTSYKYCIEEHINCAEAEKDSIFLLWNGIVLKVEEIVSIKVLEHLQVPVFDNISTGFAFSDTSWRENPPKEILYCGAYLCYHMIFVYQSDNKATKVLSEIRSFQLEIDELDKEDELDSSNGDEYDARLSSLVDQLSLEKIVLISGCTD